MSITLQCKSPVLPESLRQLLAARAGTLQIMPAIAARALTVARDPGCTATDFTTLVQRDTKLAGDTLAMANVSLFSGGRVIRTLHQAVLNLGFRHCQNLILSASMAAMMKQITMEEEWVRDVLTQHGFLTGLLGNWMNQLTGCGFQGEEFAAGLMHDIGRTLIAVCVPDKFRQFDPMEFQEDPETLTYEQSVLDSDHCEVGAWFAECNGLPTEFVDVIRYHHQPEQCPGNQRLVALIAVCDHMANHLYCTGTPDGYDLDSNHAVAVLETSGPANAGARIREAHYQMMKSAIRESHQQMSM